MCRYLGKIMCRLTYNNLTQGYTTFWNCNVLTEWSNGEIEVWNTLFDEYGFATKRKWLQKKDHIINHPEGKFFILTSEDELIGSYALDILQYSNIGYNDDNGYIIIVFDDYDEFVKTVESAGLTLGGAV